MTKEELKQEAEEYAEGMAKYYASTHEDYIPSQFEKYLRNAYISSAEPREKRIAELEMTVGTLRTFSNEQATYIESLKAQIDKLQNCWNCKKSFTKSCTFGKKCEAKKKKCKDWESTFGISN